MEMPAPWAQRLIQRFDRVKREGGPPGADEERRDREMQPIDDAGAEETGNRDAAALDEHPSVSLISKRFEDRPWFELVTAVGGNRQDVAFGRRWGIASVAAAHDEVRAAPSEKRLRGSRRASIENDATGFCPRPAATVRRSVRGWYPLHAPRRRPERGARASRMRLPRDVWDDHFRSQCVRRGSAPIAR